MLAIVAFSAQAAELELVIRSKTGTMLILTGHHGGWSVKRTEIHCVNMQAAIMKENTGGLQPSTEYT